MSIVEITVDRERLVETAGRMIDVHSFTGDEQGMAELMVELYGAAGLRVQCRSHRLRRLHNTPWSTPLCGTKGRQLS